MSEILLDTNIIRTTIIEFNRFKIKNFNLVLNEKVEIIILLYPVNSEHIVECKTIIIDGEDYANWGTDDNVLIEFIKNKLLE